MRNAEPWVGGAALDRRGATTVPERIDLGGAVTSLCLERTGTTPGGPHTLLFNRGRSHAILSFVASGHVVFFDAAARARLACIDAGAQAHAAVPAPDESYVVVANQNGKLLQRISTDSETSTFSLDGGHEADSHGAMLTKQGRYLWVADRLGNRIVVIRTATGRMVGELPLAGALSEDPSPDLLDISPAGELAFVSLRGALPLSGDPHASTGNTPGLGLIRVRKDGRTGALTGIARIANVDAGGVDRADPHGLRVRLK